MLTIHQTSDPERFIVVYRGREIEIVDATLRFRMEDIDQQEHCEELPDFTTWE
jgi:hypothetical protein